MISFFTWIAANFLIIIWLFKTRVQNWLLPQYSSSYLLETTILEDCKTQTFFLNSIREHILCVLALMCVRVFEREREKKIHHQITWFAFFFVQNTLQDRWIFFHLLFKSQTHFDFHFLLRIYCFFWKRSGQRGVRYDLCLI